MFEIKPVNFVDSNGTLIVHNTNNKNMKECKLLEKPISVNVGFLSKF